MMFGSHFGLRVVVSHFLPWQEETIGHRIYWAQPLIQWLSRWLPIRPYVFAPMLRRWQDAYRVGDTLYISPQMKAKLDRMQEAA